MLPSRYLLIFVHLRKAEQCLLCCIYFASLKGQFCSHLHSEQAPLSKHAVKQGLTREAVPPTRSRKPSVFSSAASTVTLTDFRKCSHWKDFLISPCFSRSPTESPFSEHFKIQGADAGFLEILSMWKTGCMVSYPKNATVSLSAGGSPQPHSQEGWGDAQDSFLSGKVVLTFNWLSHSFLQF